MQRDIHKVRVDCFALGPVPIEPRIKTQIPARFPHLNTKIDITIFCLPKSDILSSCTLIPTFPYNLSELNPTYRVSQQSNQTITMASLVTIHTNPNNPRDSKVRGSRPLSSIPNNPNTTNKETPDPRSRQPQQSHPHLRPMRTRQNKPHP